MPSENLKPAKIITAVAVIVVLVVMLIGVSYWSQHKKVVEEKAQEALVLGQPKQAPSGQIAQGFPQNLMAPGMNLVSSYSIPYPVKDDPKRIVNQYSVTATTDQSIDAVYKAYLELLPKYYYDILSKTNDAKAKTATILASSQHSKVTVTIGIQAGTKKTSVVVNYLEK